MYPRESEIQITHTHTHIQTRDRLSFKFCNTIFKERHAPTSESEIPSVCTALIKFDATALISFESLKMYIKRKKLEFKTLVRTIVCFIF